MVASSTRAVALDRGLRLEYLTVGWNIVEGLLSIGLAYFAGSVALLGFGVDSFVESISGLILVWRLRTERAKEHADEETIERIERRAERMIGVSFLILAVYVTIEAVRTLISRTEPEASVPGIAILIVSIAVMLWLARAKRTTADTLQSRALHADADQTMACWRLSMVALLGIALNGILGWWWADPVAAIAIAGLLLLEAHEAWEGE